MQHQVHQGDGHAEEDLVERSGADHARHADEEKAAEHLDQLPPEVVVTIVVV